jgi:beta-ureidopropionase
MTTKALIATVCQAGKYFPTVEGNRQHVIELLRLALRRSPDLVCLPETFTAPGVSYQSVEAVAESLPGPTFDAVAELARQHGCYVICPLVTRHEGACWNSAVVIDRDGQILGVYDKVHPVTSTFDYTVLESGMTPGSRAPVFDLDFGRVGIQICFDIQFPETWEELARQGARLVFWPSAYNGGFPLQMYAWLHHYYVVSSVESNKARIIDPLGAILAETDPITNVIWREINTDFAVCHYDFNYSITDRILATYPGQVEVRTNWDANHFLVEPLDDRLTIARLKAEIGFVAVDEYIALHRAAYPPLRLGQPAQPQSAAHGNRPMFSKTQEK